MKIYPLNMSDSLNFSAKKKEIRDADLIMRNAKKNFPTLSKTYVEKYYGCIKEDKHTNVKGNKIVHSLRGAINGMRFLSQSTALYLEKLNSNSKRDQEHLSVALGDIKKYKIGNCDENGKIALAALYANGYMNSRLVSLQYRTQFIDKFTGDTVFQCFSPMDHVFAVTDMNKGGKRNIVIDPWLGFADSIEGANSRFKALYDEEDFKYESMKALKKFRNYCKQTGLEFSADKYDIRSGFYYDTDLHKNVSNGDEVSKQILNSRFPELTVKINKQHT